MKFAPTPSRPAPVATMSPEEAHRVVIDSRSKLDHAAAIIRVNDGEVNKRTSIIERQRAILDDIRRNDTVERFRSAAATAPRDSSGDSARIAYHNLLANIENAQRSIADESRVLPTYQRMLDDATAQREAATAAMSEANAVLARQAVK